MKLSFLQAVNYTHTLASPLSSKLSASHPVGHFMRRRVELSPGANYSVVIPALNPEDVNSVVNVLFQVSVYICVSCMDSSIYERRCMIAKHLTVLLLQCGKSMWSECQLCIALLPGWQCVSYCPIR